MKLFIDGIKFKIIKRPENINKPLFKKGDGVEYAHDEYGKIKGAVSDVYIDSVSENIIYYRADFPNERLTVLKIPEYELKGTDNL